MIALDLLDSSVPLERVGWRRENNTGAEHNRSLQKLYDILEAIKVDWGRGEGGTFKSRKLQDLKS